MSVVSGDDAVSVFEHGEQGGTFNGNPLMTAVGCAVLEEILKPGFLARVVDAGNHLGARLRELVGTLDLSHERGLGLLRALDLGAEIAPAVVAYARDELEHHPGWDGCGLLLNAPQPHVLRFMPALNVSRADIDRMIDGLSIAIAAVRETRCTVDARA